MSVKHLPVITVLALGIVLALPLYAMQHPEAPGPTPQLGSEREELVLIPASGDAIRSDGVQFSERTPRYELCPGDVMDISFPFTPELNREGVKVQPDGFITLEALGDVHVAGMTLAEVRGALQKAYADILREPEVLVTLREFNTPYFIASGQVVRPGKYDLRAATTLVEAIAIAGGFNNSAKHSQVWLFRRQSDGSVQGRKIDVKKMLAKGDLNEDLRLQPGDTLHVPQSAWSKLRGVVVPSLTVGPRVTPNVTP